MRQQDIRTENYAFNLVSRTFLNYKMTNYFRGNQTVWVITVFEKDTFRIFEFNNKDEATVALKNFQVPSILSFTN